ncbi:MAG TPA: histidine ammonia-lyase [Oligoflexus sp.]|uniref:histidine ammonia-lyase n=1 Tax=Oligoflexus sp. TaxID=1971216 RepID=UPI002D802613|nr:histidine ammonia-lyase [Oligoflexus sp.]HET9238764.1 histidine ammonia-lyase [Oligoflexus sp.]
MSFQLGQDRLTTALLYQQVASGKPQATLPAASRERVKRYRQLVQSALDSGKTYYGINTGFGYLSDVRIETSKLSQLQDNLVRSHACGVGDYVEPAVVRGLLLLRAHTFSLGYSGVSEACLDTILEFLKHDILPMIPAQGSVGASGDLAPLAHLALGLIGEGRVLYKGEVMPAAQALDKAGVKPVKLGPKEGLSLINGTQFMAVEASIALEEARILTQSADIIAALSLDALRGTLKAFDPRIHEIRPHVGQQQSAERIRSLFKEHDPIVESHSDCSRVQDPYSFRCVPQVHGATYDTLAFVEKQINTELNSVTDNPLCFENGEILSGGNFHGQPMALAMDFLGIAMAEIGSISERRTEKLTNPNLSGLPAFLTRESGLNSGYMIPHVVAAALVSENKVLAHPASVDSIPTSADKEDHVSMGPIAALKARRILKNIANILSIELLAACQGIDLLAPLQPNPRLKKIYDSVRAQAPAMDTDRSLHDEIKNLSAWILDGSLLKCAEES